MVRFSVSFWGAKSFEPQVEFKLGLWLIEKDPYL